jgi:hypothetical protein
MDAGVDVKASRVAANGILAATIHTPAAVEWAKHMDPGAQ